MEKNDDGHETYLINRFLSSLSISEPNELSHEIDSSDETISSDFTFSQHEELDLVEWTPTKQWKLQDKLKPIDEVLLLMREFRSELKAKKRKEQQQEGFKKQFKVKYMRSRAILDKIDDFACQTVNTLIEHGQFCFQIPTYITVYNKNLKRNIAVQGKKYSPPVSMASRRKAACYARIIEVIHRSLVQRVPFSLSFLYYQDPVVFGNDRYVVSPMLDKLCLKFGCTRDSLNVFGSEKGMVKGPLEFKIGNLDFDCNDELTIPSNVGHIQIASLKTRARFILIVEKHSVYTNIVNDGFQKRCNCIIITAKGQPDLSTRMFLKILCEKAKIPVFALMDGDPYGFDIMSVYKFGSRSMAYDNLAVERIVWLGILPSDVETFGLPRQFMMQLSNTDLERCRQILSYEYVKDNDDYVEELELMMKTKLKIELDALSRFDMRYIPRFYLPFKLQQAVEQAARKNRLEIADGARRDSGSFQEPKLSLELAAKPPGYNVSDSDSNEV